MRSNSVFDADPIRRGELEAEERKGKGEAAFASVLAAQFAAGVRSLSVARLEATAGRELEMCWKKARWGKAGGQYTIPRDYLPLGWEGQEVSKRTNSAWPMT